jgi:membrane protease YdiL (CAAX protease family)
MMLAAALLLATVALIAHGWWRGRSLAAWVAIRVRGRSPSRPRATLGWAAGIVVMYGATSVVALAVVGRLDALIILPRELREAAGGLGIAPIALEALWEIGAAIGGGFVLGALVVVLAARRGWRMIGPSYRSPAMAASGREAGAALVLAAAAGIGEELFFRLVVPLLAAIVSDSGVAGCVLGWALFTLAHRYQGRGGMAAVALVGAVLGWLYLATGALWLVVLLHALVDANALVLRPWLERRLRG